MSKSKKKAKAVALIAKNAGSLSDPASSRLFSNIVSNAGVAVTPTSALTVPAFLCGIRAISEDIAKMSINVTRPTKNRTGHVPFFEHPLNEVIDRPNEWQARYDWIAFCAASYAMRGNSYTVIVRDDGFTPSRLIPLSPDICSPQLMPDGRVCFCVNHPLIDAGGAVWVRSEDMIHVRGFSMNGWLGLNPIAMMAEAIGVSIATAQHASKLFGNGQSLSGVIKYPGTLSPEAANRLAESWRQAYSGPANAHKPAVLEQGGEFQQLGLSSEQSQFLSTRQFQIGDIARALRIPPHKLQDLSNAHFDNLESQEQTYINDTLRPFCDRFESECHAKLLMPDERKLGLRVKFDFDSIVRGTTEDRYKNYAVGFQNGWLNTDEIRRSEGMPDIPDGKGQEYRVSLATTPAGNPPEEKPNKVPPTGTPSRQEKS